jgi:hypothetical protein
MKFGRQQFEDVVEAVADVSGAEPGAFRDFAVFEVFPVLEPEQFLVGRFQFRDDEPELPFGFQLAEGFVRGFPSFLRFRRGIAEDLAAVIPVMVGGPVAHAPVEPGEGFPDLVPVGVELEEGFLDDVFGDLPAPHQPEGITEEPTFLGDEQVAQAGRLPRG